MRSQIVEVESGVKGVEWRIEKGKEVKIPKIVAKQIITTAREFAAIQQKVKQIEQEMEKMEREAKPHRETIIEFAQKYPGWRGVKESEKFVITVTPRPFWRAAVLQQYLGSLYYPLLEEGELIIKISLPIFGKKGVILPQTILAAIEELLLKLGASLEGTIISVEEKAHKVKEEKIEELQTKGKLPPLPSNAKEIVWSISFRTLAEG